MKNNNLKKELSIEELLKETYIVFKQNFKNILLALIIYFPIFLLLVTAVFFRIIISESILDYLIISLLIIAMSIISIFIYSYIFLIAKNHYGFKKENLKNILKTIFFKIPKIMYTVIIMILLIIIPFVISILLAIINKWFLILIIPSSFLLIKNMYYWIFSIHIPLFSGESGLNALRISKNLVKKKWWNTFFKIFILSVISSLSSMILTGLPLSNIYLIPFIILSLILSGYCILGQAILFLNYVNIKK